MNFVFDHALRRALEMTVRGLIRVYQRSVSPAIHLLAGPGYGCRFVPSCSEYVAQAFERHGAWTGALLGARRLCSCHPWGRSGWDPVPNRPAHPSIEESI